MIHLSNEDAEKRGSDLVELIEQDVEDCAGRMQKLATIRKLYYGITDRVLRYKGQPNIHLPIVTEKIEGIVPKEMNAFWAAEPHVHVRKVGGKGDLEGARLVEEHQNWACESDIPSFYETTEIWFRNRHLDGVSVVKAYYDYRTRWTTIVMPAKHSWRAGEKDLSTQQVPFDRPKLPYEILVGLFGPTLIVRAIERLEFPESEDGGTPVAYTKYWDYDDAQNAALAETTDLLGMRCLIEFIEDRRQYAGVEVEFVPSPFVDEVNARVYRPVIAKDNVEVDNIDIENIVVPYRSKNLQEAPYVAQLYWLSYDEIKFRRRRGGWSLTEEDMVAIKNAVTTTDQQEVMPENRDLRDITDRAVGQQAGTGRSRKSALAPYSANKALIFEVYLRDDLNGDGEYEELIYQIPYGLEKVVYACHLDEQFPHGRRPFPEIHSIPVNGQFLSLSLAEFLAPINVEVNAIVNLVHENQELINNPWFFYVPAMFTIDPQMLTNLKPGMGVPVADINSVMLPKFPQEPLANLSAVDSLLLFADRLTVSPQAMGSSQVRNAPRTARGTLALLSEGGIKIDAYIMAAQKGGWRELMHQIHSLYAHFGSDEKVFWVTGDPTPRTLKRDALSGRFEFSFHGNSVNTNREVRRSIAQLRYQTLITNPLYAMDLNAMANLTRDLLRHFSEGIDIEELMPRVPGMGGTHPPYSQDAENQMMMQLVPVSVLPTDDHANHMTVVQKLLQSPVFEQLPPEAVALIGNHFTMHANLLQQQAQQGATAPGGNMANNQPTEMTGAGGELSGLEGGVV